MNVQNKSSYIAITSVGCFQRMLQNSMKSSTSATNENQKCHELSRKQLDIRTGKDYLLLKLTSNNMSNSKVIVLLSALRIESCSQGI